MFEFRNNELKGNRRIIMVSHSPKHTFNQEWFDEYASLSSEFLKFLLIFGGKCLLIPKKSVVPDDLTKLFFDSRLKPLLKR